VEEFRGQQSGHAQRSGPEVKNGRIAKDGAPERLKCGINPGELDPAVADRRRCKKILLPFYPA